jgi:hypothetical protein
MMGNQNNGVFWRWRLFWFIPNDNKIRRDGIGDFGDFGPDVLKKYKDEMEHYFAFDRKLYPEKKKYPRIGLKSFRYFRIAQDDTDRMFPLDHDIRRCIDELRRAFVRNILLYLFLKRSALILFFVAMVMTFNAMTYGQIDFAHLTQRAGFGVSGSALALVVVGVISLIFIFIVFLIYTSCLRTSANSVATLIEHRMSDLKQLLSELTSKMHTQEASRVAQWDDDWPALAAFMVKLIIWVSKRMEYIEKYMQSEMWRIARTQSRAIITGWVIAGLSLLGLLLYTYHFGLGPSTPHGYGSLVTLFWILCGGIWLVTSFWLSAAPREIQTALERHVTRITEARLDEIVGSLIRTDKDKIMSLSHPAEAARPRASRDPDPKPA